MLCRVSSRTDLLSASPAFARFLTEAPIASSSTRCGLNPDWPNPAVPIDLPGRYVSCLEEANQNEDTRTLALFIEESTTTPTSQEDNICWTRIGDTNSGHGFPPFARY